MRAHGPAFALIASLLLAGASARPSRPPPSSAADEGLAQLRAAFPALEDPAPRRPARSAPPCGAPLIDLARVHWEELDAELRSRVPPSWRPAGAGIAAASGAPIERIGDVVCDAYVDTEHFRIHYSTRPGRLALHARGWDIAVDGEHAFIAADTLGLVCVDVSDPRTPRQVASLQTTGRASAVAVSGGYAYVSSTTGPVVVVDVRDPEAPVAVAAVPLLAPLIGASDGWVYAAGSIQGGSGISFLDVSMPAAPEVVAEVPIDGLPYDLLIAGDRLIVATSSGLTLVDISTPGTPTVVGELAMPGPVSRLGIRDRHVLALGTDPQAPVDAKSMLWTVDILDASFPALVHAMPLGALVRDLLVNGDVAYVVDTRTIRALDVSVPTAPHPVSEDVGVGHSRGMATSGDMLYVLADDDIAIVDVWEPLYPRVVDDRLPGWPSLDYVDDVGEMVERAYVRFHEELGLRRPVPDGTRGGGEDLVDCYIYRLEYSTWGFARIESPGETECPGAYTGLFTLHTSRIPSYITPAEVAIHEYFHVVQYAHDIGQGTWFRESTASWAPFSLLPDDTSWLWATSDWFRSPQLPLTNVSNSREYGAVHYWLFQDQITDSAFVSNVWKGCCDQNWRTALDDELDRRDLDFDSTFVSFSIWNALTRERDDGRHHAYAASLPEIRIHARHGIYPADGAYPVIDAAVEPDELADELGTNYIRFTGPGARERLVITLDGDPSAATTRRVSAIATTADMRHTITTVTPDASGDCRLEIPDWPTLAEVTLVVTNLEGPIPDRTFTYSAREEGAPAPPVLLAVSPNPTRGAVRFAVRLPAPTAVSLRIYDLGGRLVRRVHDGVLGRGIHTVSWDGVRKGRNPTPAGVYFYELRVGDRRETDRIVRLR